MQPIAIHSRRTLLEDQLTDATVFVDGGRIVRIANGNETDEAFAVLECEDDVLMPGLIDCHVHINEPGRTEWEGFDTATRAAAHGGITTLVDMPLNSSPVTINTTSFQKKKSSAHNQLNVNCGFWGGLIPGHSGELESLMQSGVLGLKAFLTHSGIDEFPNVSEMDIREAVAVLRDTGAPLLVHCELDTPHAGQQALLANPTSYQAYLASRPKSWEDKAIELMIRLCEETGIRVHIVHLSSASSLPQLRNARTRGLPVTVETCPHYLVFDAEHIPDGQTAYKCAPPIREKVNNEILWTALKTGDIDFVVTDHSPAPPDLKELESGDFSKAWGGIAGLQFSLPVFWSAAKERGFTISDISRLMSANAASFLRMGNRKGHIRVGYDADLTVWSPERSFGVTESSIQHRHKVTPYLGMTLRGVIRHTLVGGSLVIQNEQFREHSRGQILHRI